MLYDHSFYQMNKIINNVRDNIDTNEQANMLNKTNT